MLQTSEGKSRMKRLYPGLLALLMFAFGNVPAANAWWFWHRHSSPPPAGVGADKKSASKKSAREARQKEKPVHIYNKPRSIGSWFHPHDSPGPMGAGAPEK
jgi:hypothetical protein